MTRVSPNETEADDVAASSMPPTLAPMSGDGMPVVPNSSSAPEISALPQPPKAILPPLVSAPLEKVDRVWGLCVFLWGTTIAKSLRACKRPYHESTCLYETIVSTNLGSSLQHFAPLDPSLKLLVCCGVFNVALVDAVAIVVHDSYGKGRTRRQQLQPSTCSLSVRDHLRVPSELDHGMNPLWG